MYLLQILSARCGTLILCLLFVSSYLNISCQTLPEKNKIIKAQKERPDHASAEAYGSHYAIATQGRYASQAGEKMFSLGGNIIDATVAASFVISVERPQSTGVGGGGFMVFHQASTGQTYAIDFRERAPIKASKDMFTDGKGNVDPLLSRNGILAVAIPGLVAGLIEIHQKFGSLSLATVMQPAIDLAENGFPIYPEFRKALENRAQELKKDAAAKAIFLDSQGNVPPLNAVLVQKDLAKTLKLIAEKGKDGFYKGATADSIIKLSRKSKGLVAKQDFESYQVKWRKPIQGRFKNYTVMTMPPPSSGGVHVLQFLKFLEADNLFKDGALSAKAIHLEASALQSSFADRAAYLGDPDFVEVPVKGLISSQYIKHRREEVPVNRARASADVFAGNPFPYESTETTHISIIDNEGNAVSTTQTINGWMGAAIVAPGTGVVLNNEMDDFSAKEGASNLFGAIGGKPNSIAPQKTPLSSMSPTIIFHDGKPVMSIGAPGGTRIISCVAQTILNYFEFKESLYDSIAMVRLHHQWQPDVLYLDPPGPQSKTLKQLQEMGYKVELEPILCNVMAVAKENNQLHGVADPRDIGTSVAK